MGYTLTLPGTPPRKNRRHLLVGRGGLARTINSPEFKAFVLTIEAAWAKAQHPKIQSGLWRLNLHAVWPRTRHLDIPTACGDVDAPISWVLDALQAAGALDDDSRIVELGATKEKGPNPGLVITLTQLS